MGTKEDQTQRTNFCHWKSVWSSVSIQEQGKAFKYRVVWLASAELWLWQEGWEEAERVFSTCVPRVYDKTTASSSSAFLPPYTSAPEWAESTDSHARTNIFYTCKQTRSTHKTLVFTGDADMTTCTLIILPLATPRPGLGSHVEMRGVSAGVQSKPLYEINIAAAFKWCTDAWT